jgi:hypothetical protein
MKMFGTKPSQNLEKMLSTSMFKQDKFVDDKVGYANSSVDGIATGAVQHLQLWEFQVILPFPVQINDTVCSQVSLCVFGTIFVFVPDSLSL